jgi:L-ascorbate metabolism protein UlaG (beta-lactamase superfamily)
MNSRILSVALSATLLLAPEFASSQATTSSTTDSVVLLHKALPEKEAIIWYLGQDSFAVKTRNHVLIFDALSPGMENSYALPKSADSLSEGVVNPDTIKDLDVMVFTTDMGDSHYGTGIWPWHRYIKTINYVFGWDPIINQDAHEYVYMKPHDQKTIEGVDISTMQASTFGTGFLIKVDGLTLFHGGNHIQLDDSMKQRFTHEIDYLAGKAPQIDIAFLEFQTGAGNRPASIAEGIWYADKKLSPKVIFPMGAMNADIPFRTRRTPEGQKAQATTYEGLIKDLIKEAPSDAVRAKIVETGKRGEVFTFHDGRIDR